MSRLVTCSGCRKREPHHARGLCMACYKKAWHAGTLDGLDFAYADCATPGCKEHVAAPDRDVCLGCLVARLGITYRQMDHWTRRGWLFPAGGNGSGRVREWPPAELEIAARMSRLARSGIPPERAAAFARESWPSGEIAPGITLEVIAC